MKEIKLFMILLGATPPGRHTEQHDIFFGIGSSLGELVPAIRDFWPEAAGRIHIDAWREVTRVDGYRIAIVPRSDDSGPGLSRLFFINLGGYKEELFDEPHYKIVTVQPDKAAAIRYAKETWFFRTAWFPGANAHIDDKFGVDVDDLHEIEDLLPPAQKAMYRLLISPCETEPEDEIHLGYFKLNSLS